jgi:hypothetical protein
VGFWHWTEPELFRDALSAAEGDPDLSVNWEPACGSAALSAAVLTNALRIEVAIVPALRTINSPLWSWVEATEGHPSLAFAKVGGTARSLEITDWQIPPMLLSPITVESIGPDGLQGELGSQLQIPHSSGTIVFKGAAPGVV